MEFKNPNTDILSDKKLYIFDMDGTIYLGYNVFDFAIKFINNLRANGKKILFFTNNASHTDEYYLTKLTKLGCSQRFLGMQVIKTGHVDAAKSVFHHFLIFDLFDISADFCN